MSSTWIKYVGERVYPYVISVIIAIIFYQLKYNFVGSKNISGAIEGVITVASLIIGFMGAMLPVLSMMRQNSDFVRDVFSNDQKGLFLKYLKAMLLSGLFLIVFSILLYFVSEMPDGVLKKYGFYGWIYMISCFMLTTYRCMSGVLKLVFEDGGKQDKRNSSPPSTPSEIEFKNFLRQRK